MKDFISCVAHHACVSVAIPRLIILPAQQGGEVYGATYSEINVGILLIVIWCIVVAKCAASLLLYSYFSKINSILIYSEYR